MLEYYGVTPASGKHGIVLHPSKAEVTYQNGGRYDLDVEIPMMSDGYLSLETELVNSYGNYLKASVPRQHIPEIDLGPIYTWRVKSGQSADFLKNLPYTQRIAYQAWTPGRSYMAGDKVTSDGQNWQCTTGHGGITTPPAQNPTLWTTIANYTQVPGTVIATLSAGTQFVKLGDYNTTYMRIQYNNKEGFIEISKCEYANISGERTIPARDIDSQLFRITEVVKDSKSNLMKVHAVHISYLLNGMLLDECDMVQATPQMTLAAISGAMMEDWPGEFLTSITTGTITEDYTNKMAGEVLLNPSSGFISQVDGRLIRDNYDIIILPNTDSTTAAVYEVKYGVNLTGVTWRLNIDNIVTRIYPVAKNSDDSTLWLSGQHYVDSLYAHPWVVMELLDTGLRVGETEKKSDGTETTLTVNAVRTRMAQEAQKRFDKDKCDMPDITLDVDFVDLGDTEEYKQFKGLANVAPYEWVNVVHGPFEITASVQLIGYTWDCIRDVYKKTTFGDVRQMIGRSVTDYDLRTGAVTRRALSASLKRALNL